MPLIIRTLAFAMLVFLGSALLAQEETALDVSSISSFDTKRDVAEWVVVNDGVMGGRSVGRTALTRDGSLLFTGRTSLENNGGFSSIRMRPRALGLGGFDGIVVRVKGDGRKYTMTLATTASRRRGVNYWAGFATVRDRWTDVRIPFSAFTPRFRGSMLDGFALRPSEIVSLGVMIYDKQAGPFRLEIDEIRRWRKSADEVRAADAGRSASNRTSMDPRVEVLIRAIDRGVPLFNAGNADACVAVYEIAALAVLRWPGRPVSRSVRDALTAAVKGGGTARSAADAAWALRRAMDAALTELQMTPAPATGDAPRRGA